MLPKLPTIEEAARLMRQKELTPLDLVEHCLARIAQFEDRIHAWVLVDEEGARKEARRLTDMLARGEDLGPLHGIPIGIKDIIDVAGWQTKCGSKLRENVAPAEKDATVVANLRKAGAIILGKTVTTEFACFDPPPTRNPWNLEHTPGGSSSGSAAAVAMEMCMAALGTQTGGSIIRPAAYCGVCGYKPQFNSVHMQGIMPFSYHLDHVGPIARSVYDLEWTGHAMFFAGRLLPYEETRSESPPSDSVRILVGPKQFYEHCSSEIGTALDEVIKSFAASGATVKSRQLPPTFHAVHKMHRRIMAAEAATVHRATFEGNVAGYSPHIRSLIAEGLAMGATEYSEALQHQRDFRGSLWNWFSELGDDWSSVLMVPATPTVAAATLDSTGDPKFNSPWTYSWLPTITVPVARDSQGLPIGVQFVGIHQDFVINAARLCEAQVGWISLPDILKESQ